VTREQKIAKARELRGQRPRPTYREIAEALGVSTGTVYRWINRTASYCNGREINPERARAHDRRYNKEKRFYPDCPRCGAKMSPKSSLCEGCRVDEIDRRARQIEAWWGDGLKFREIADRLGWTVGHLSVEMDRLRSKGYHLPYRYKLGRRAGAKFPEQVAA
jgi:transposase